MRFLSVLFIAGITFMSFVGCGDDTTKTSGTAGSGGSAGSGGEGGSAGSGGGSGGGAPTGGYCGKSCAMPVDCCPVGAPMCPGAYPNNWTCDNGVCGAPQCSTDDDCTFGGALMGYACLTVDSLKFCAKTCAADADCSMQMLTCSGSDDGGKKYCSTTTMGGGCKADADCMGYGKCNTTSGACECSADGDCSGAGVDKCVQ
jgi:hypothetical protein